jgi:phosphohistidine phosphatase
MCGAIKFFGFPVIRNIFWRWNHIKTTKFRNLLYPDIMKQLIIVRHAKSSRDPSIPADFDRPLNERGHKDAPLMAQRLLQDKVAIDVIVSSPAKRALTTALYFAEAYHIKEKNIIKASELYEAPSFVFFDVIAKLDNTHNNVGIFAHNPGITNFINQLTTTRIDHMPTCAAFAVKAAIERWEDFERAAKIFWFFDYPEHK